MKTFKLTRQQRAKGRREWARRRERFLAQGLTSRGKPVNPFARHHYDLDQRGLTGLPRQRELARQLRAFRRAAGLNSRGQFRKIGMLPSAELAWRNFRSTLELPQAA